MSLESIHKEMKIVDPSKEKDCGCSRKKSKQQTGDNTTNQDSAEKKPTPKRFKDGAAYVWFTDGVLYDTFEQARTAARTTLLNGYTMVPDLTSGIGIYRTALFGNPYSRTEESSYLGLNDGFGNEYVVTMNWSYLIDTVDQTKETSKVGKDESALTETVIKRQVDVLTGADVPWSTLA